MENLLPFERTNNRQTYYLQRILTRERFEKPEKTTFASTLIFLLEQLMNQYKYCAWIIEKRKIKKASSKTVLMQKKIHEKLELVYRLYFSYSQSLFEQIRNKTINVNSKTGENMQIINNDPPIMHYLLNMIDKLNYISYQIHGINS